MAYKRTPTQDDGVRFDPDYEPYQPPTYQPPAGGAPEGDAERNPHVEPNDDIYGGSDLWKIAQQIAQQPAMTAQQRQAEDDAHEPAGPPAGQMASGWQSYQYNVPAPPGGYFTNWQQSAPRMQAPAPFYSGVGTQSQQLQGLQPYQAAQFQQRNVQPSMQNAIRPGDLQQYNAANVQQFAPSGQGQQFQTIAQQLAQAFAGNAMPNVTGMQEQQKEQLLALRDQAMNAAQMSAAGRGTLGGGALMGREGAIQDAFSSDLTKAYRDLALQGQQMGFQNQLAGAQAAGNLAAQLAESERANYASSLAGTGLQESLRQAAAQNALQRAQYGLDFGQQEFGQNLAAQQFGFGQEQAQANERARANELALQLAQAQSGDQLSRGQFLLNQNQANFQNQLGANQFNLGSQGFELQAQQGGLQEWLARLNMAQQAQQMENAQANAGVSAGLAGRGLDIQAANAEAAQQANYVNLILGLLGGG